MLKHFFIKGKNLGVEGLNFVTMHFDRAIKQNNYKEVRFLLRHGMEIDKFSMDLAWELGNDDMFNLLYEVYESRQKCQKEAISIDSIGELR